MAAMIADGTMVVLILALVAVEALALCVYRWRTGHGPRLRDVIFNLAAGAALLMALHSAIAGDSWIWIAGWLAAALVAHLGDMASRLRRQ